MFESYENPPQKFFHVFFPTHGEGKEAHEAVMDEAAKLLYMWHVNDPASYWKKVIDSNTGKIASGALENP